MSTFQEFQVRVGRLVTELNTTFGYDLSSSSVLSGMIGGPQAFLNALILPIWESESAQAKLCRSQAYTAANLAVAQAFFAERLAGEFTDAIHRASRVAFPGRAGNYVDLVRQIICDGLAIKFAVERFVHPEAQDDLLYHQAGGREQAMRRALFAITHIAVHGSNLQQEGIAKFMRVRLIAGLREYKGYFGVSGERLQKQLQVQGIKAFTGKAHTLLHHVITYQSPAGLTERNTQGEARRLSVV